MDILKIKATPCSKAYKMLQLDNQSHEILQKLSKKTDISMSRLAAEMIKFCVDRVEVEA